MSSLLSKYAIEPSRIGRVDVSSSGSSRAITASIMNMLRSAGNAEVEGIVSWNSSYASVTSFVSAVNWIESSSWDGRYGHRRELRDKRSCSYQCRRTCYS